MDFYRNRVLRGILLALRVILGAIFVYGGYVKLQAPWALFGMAIDSYHLVPLRYIEPLARTVPWFEVGLGLLLTCMGLRTARRMAEWPIRKSPPANSPTTRNSIPASRKRILRGPPCALCGATWWAASARSPALIPARAC